MNHRLQTFFAALISSVLVYYSVAWAVMRCFHGEDRAGTEIAIAYAGIHENDLFTSPSNHPKADIACMGWNYPIETLAASSVFTQLKLSRTDIASRVNGFLLSNGIAEAAVVNRWPPRSWCRWSVCGVRWTITWRTRVPPPPAPRQARGRRSAPSQCTRRRSPCPAARASARARDGHATRHRAAGAAVETRRAPYYGTNGSGESVNG